MDTPGSSADADNTADAPTLITLAVTALALIDPESPPGAAEKSSHRALHTMLPDHQRALACEQLVLACMRVTDNLDGGKGASWIIPPSPGSSPDIDLHRRLLGRLRDRYRNDTVGPVVTDAAANAHDLQDVAGALTDLAEIALLTVLNTVRAQRPPSGPRGGGVPSNGELLRRCLDLVAEAVTGDRTSG
jgi:hypothetical protein